MLFRSGDGQPAYSPQVRDAAMGIIKMVRPAVAAISDKKERAQVADALIAAIKEPEKMGGILHAVQDSAREKSAGRPSFEQTCAAQAAAYAARNPHTNQEGQ